MDVKRMIESIEDLNKLMHAVSGLLVTIASVVLLIYALISVIQTHAGGSHQNFTQTEVSKKP